MKTQRRFFAVLLLSCFSLLPTTAIADDLMLQGELSGLYHATGIIYTEGTCTVETGNTATCVAYTSVMLNPGFRVKSGSTFQARIEDSTDTDTDDLPDWWEQYYFGNLNQGTYDDYDSDGISNYTEYLLGTDPTDPGDEPQSSEDTDYGRASDEQQGGGGLVGETIRILNGNATEYRSDLRFSSPHRMGLAFESYYNSRSTILGALGYGWSHTYETSLDPACEIGGITYLKIIDATGRAHLFFHEGGGIYEGVFGEHSYVEEEAGGYAWYRLDGFIYNFSTTGTLTRIDDPPGNQLQLAYDGSNRLTTVSDLASGRVLTMHYNAQGLLEYVSGPVTDAVADGIWVEYDYDLDQNLISVNYADASGINYSYTDSTDIYNLTEKRDALNHLLSTWSYDAQDRAVSTFTVNGTGVDVSYVSDTQVQVTDAYGTLRTYTLEQIDGRNRVSAVTGTIPGGAPYAPGNIVRWEYDGAMNLVEVETSGGTVHKYQDFDDRGNPGTVIIAYATDEERTVTYTFHPGMNAALTRIEASVLGAGDKETIWDYDDDYDSVPNENPTNLVSQIIEKGYTRDTYGTIDTYEYITTLTYNTKGQVTSIDGLRPGTGDTTSFGYNPTNGDLLSITRPHIGITAFASYDAAGQVGTVTDVNSHITGFAYDGRGRVVTITNYADDPDSTIEFDYNTAGQLAVKTDEDGVTRSFTYDTNHGRLEKITDHTGNYISLLYDSQGNVTDRSYYDQYNNHKNWKRYNYQYTSMPGKLWKVINHDSTFTEYGYDAEGNVTTITDPRTNSTTYIYDSLNRLTSVTQPGSVTNTYGYDTHGNLEAVTDAESHETTYEYDDMGRLVSTVSPDTGTMTYAYDEAGNLISKTDAKAITVTYDYDDLNRLTEINFPDPLQDITYTYDELTRTNGIGRLTSMVDPSGTITFDYTDRGRLAVKTSTISSQAYPLTYSYTQAGRISTITYPTGRTVDYYRTSCPCTVNKVSTTFSGNTVTLMDNITYRPFGVADTMDTGAGDTVSNTHDLSGRLTTANPGQPMEQSYTYDPAGNLTSIQCALNPWYNRTFTYDALNRLNQAQGPYGTIDYTYDTVGNRLTKVVDDQTDTYAYLTGTNKLDEITGVNPITFTHDANGNITEIGDMTLTYNQSNRLITVKENETTIAEYTYNGMGQRVLKEVDATTTVYHYDAQGNLIAESDMSGTFAYEYLYRGDNLLAMVDVSTGSVYFYLNDRLGTPQALTDADNIAVWEATYKPFGEAEVDSNATVVNNFRFPGQYYDQETGLHYNYFRYYSPTIGRYITPDPIGMIGGINLFLYAENNPVNSLDPFGLLNILLGGGGSVIAITGAEGSGGVVINPGIGDDKADVGLFGSIGTGGGVNVSGDIFVGYVKGGIENVSGITTNINIVAGPISLTVFVNPSTNEVTGGTIGLGPPVLPAGASGTLSITGTYTLRDLIRHLKKLIAENIKFWEQTQCE